MQPTAERTTDDGYSLSKYEKHKLKEDKQETKRWNES